MSTFPRGSRGGLGRPRGSPHRAGMLFGRCNTYTIYTYTHSLEREMLFVFMCLTNKSISMCIYIYIYTYMSRLEQLQSLQISAVLHTTSAKALQTSAKQLPRDMSYLQSERGTWLSTEEHVVRSIDCCAHCPWNLEVSHELKLG